MSVRSLFRYAAAHMVCVTIMGKPGCHLCDVMMKIARHVQADLLFDLRYVDISSSDALATRYGNRIPVLLIEEVETFSGKVTEGNLRRAIKRARWSRPVSRILSRLRKLLKRG